MTGQFYLDIGLWQKETFPSATAKSKLHHALKELKELEEELSKEMRDESIGLEIADCFILLYGAANSLGLTLREVEGGMNNCVIHIQINRTGSYVRFLRVLVEEIITFVDSPAEFRDTTSALCCCIKMMYIVAHKLGIGYHEVMDVISKKMQINYKREWGTPDKDGVVLHIKKDGE